MNANNPIPSGYGRDSASFRALNPHQFAPEFSRANPSKGDIAEGDLHDQFEKWLKENGWFCIHSRMDKPSTIEVGTPDFTVFLPDRLVVFVEMKRPGEKTTLAQNIKLAHARKFGFPAEVCDNVPAAKAIVLAVLDGSYRQPKK